MLRTWRHPWPSKTRIRFVRKFCWLCLSFDHLAAILLLLSSSASSLTVYCKTSQPSSLLPPLPLFGLFYLIIEPQWSFQNMSDNFLLLLKEGLPDSLTITFSPFTDLKGHSLHPSPCTPMPCPALSLISLTFICSVLGTLASCYSCNMPSMLPHWSLCICCFLCLEFFSPSFSSTISHLNFLLKCYFLYEVLPPYWKWQPIATDPIYHAFTEFLSPASILLKILIYYVCCLVSDSSC